MTVFQINIPRHELKNSKDLTAFHKFIQKNSDAGIISRQEAVSMIPPMLLDVQLGEKVFDMCAAPGSKTGQFLESVYRDFDYFGDSIVKDVGFVLANDNNPKRAHMMTHQLKRLNTAGMIVVAHDAQHFPGVFEGDDRVMFDKILADVPCSSDAVMRKLPTKWAEWSPRDGLQLHKLQLSILKRGVSALKTGGLIVYSTCSLNPIENEAVVAAIMKMHPGCLEIVDSRKLFEGSAITPREGLTSWKVFGELKKAKEMQEFASFDEIQDPEMKKLVPETAFAGQSEELVKLGIPNCVRILPHDGDTNGFFITLLRKTSPLMYGSNKNKSKDKVQQSKGFTFFNENFNTWAQWIKEYYGLTDAFPLDQLITVSDEGKRVNLVSRGVADLINNDSRNQLKIINSGVKIFERQKVKNEDESTFCHYRICQDGVNYVVPYMSKSLVFVSEEAFVYCLKKENLNLAKIENEELKSQLEVTKPGSVVICHVTDVDKVRQRGKVLAGELVEAVTSHLTQSSISLMLSKEHKQQLSLRYDI